MRLYLGSRCVGAIWPDKYLACQVEAGNELMAVPEKGDFRVSKVNVISSWSMTMLLVPAVIACQAEEKIAGAAALRTEFDVGMSSYTLPVGKS